VNRIEQRVNEAIKLGFKQIIMPRHDIEKIKTPDGVRLRPVDSLQQAIEQVI